MRDRDKALEHLEHAKSAIHKGDGAKSRHHIGHALSACKEKSEKDWMGGVMKKALHAKTDQPTPVKESVAPVTRSRLADALKKMHKIKSV